MADAQYRVTEKAGRLRYPPGRVADAGDVVSDLPAESLRWLLDSGYVEPVEPPKPKPKKKAAKKATAGGGDGE